MKKYFVLLITIALLAGACCQEKIDAEKEKEAIIAVIEGITQSHQAGDWDTYLSLWPNEPYDYFIRVFEDCAWAEYKIKWTSVTEGSDETEEWETHENYSFEKRDGVWKVATVSAVDITSYEKEAVEGEEMKEENEEDEGMEEEAE